MEIHPVRRFQYEPPMKALRRMITGCAVALIFLAVGCFQEPRYESIESSSDWVEGSHTIYYFDSLESGETGLFTIELNGSSERKLIATSIYEVVLSSDGKKIAFTRYKGEAPRCGIIDLERDETLALPGPCDNLDFSPDGDLLAYTCEDEDYSWGKLFIYDTVSRSNQLVTTISGPIVGPRWSQDGSRLYFWGLFTDAMYVASPADMTVIAIEGVEKPKQYVRSEIGLSNLHFNQYNSSDIGWFRARAPRGAGYAIVREGSLYVVDLAGEERLLLENVGARPDDFGSRGLDSPEWTGDGRYILTELDDELVVVDVESGRAGIVTKGRGPLAYRPDYHPGEGSTVNPFYYSFSKMAGHR